MRKPTITLLVPLLLGWGSSGCKHDTPPPDPTRNAHSADANQQQLRFLQERERSILERRSMSLRARRR